MNPDRTGNLRQERLTGAPLTRASIFTMGTYFAKCVPMSEGSKTVKGLRGCAETGKSHRIDTKWLMSRIKTESGTLNRRSLR